MFFLELSGGESPVGHPPGIYLARTVGHGCSSGCGQICGVDIDHGEHFVVDEDAGALD